MQKAQGRERQERRSSGLPAVQHGQKVKSSDGIPGRRRGPHPFQGQQTPDVDLPLSIRCPSGCLLAWPFLSCENGQRARNLGPTGCKLLKRRDAPALATGPDFFSGGGDEESGDHPTQPHRRTVDA